MLVVIFIFKILDFTIIPFFLILMGSLNDQVLNLFFNGYEFESLQGH
jgi:hypothetical protein